ncbi:hypothetical protein BMS3Abin10_02280 [bacterium BMS3Abin10]|nr:hypothetical protein BMS3Abin10_02280 [bacterium BMS3Abin10]GBE38532.1 hypothetical protein BMS3Bbin08_01139 [bacterium BMS3Bbin08]
MSIKTKYIIGLLLLGIVDVVIPVPILEVVLIYVILAKPPWFRDIVQKIYTE